MLILFRCDARAPSEIFENGFSTRKPPEHKIDDTEPFTSKVDYSIGFSAKLEPTPYFPYSTNETQTWIYVVVVDDNQDAMHYLDLHSLSLSIGTISSLAFILPFIEFPKEKNTIRVNPENVVCAFPIERNLRMISNNLQLYRDSFKILSAAIMNDKSIDVFNTNPRMKKNLNDIIEKYNAKVGQEIDVAQPNPKYPVQLKRAKIHNAFFIINRLEPLSEYKQTHIRQREHDLESTKAFFKTASLQNSSGLLFASKAQICKQNSLFYAAVTESNLFDERIEEESIEIEKIRSESKKEYYKKNKFVFNKIDFPKLYGEEVREAEVSRKRSRT